MGDVGTTKGRGMLTMAGLEERVSNQTIDTVAVAFTDHYGRVHGKRFDARFFLEETHEAGTHGCDYLLTVDMEMEPIAGYRYANWELGYGDFHMVPDLSTLRVASWLDRTAFVLCDLHDSDTHELVSVAPRSILRGQLQRMGSEGYTGKAASELEYFLYEDSYREAAERGYQGLQPIGWYIEDYHLLQGSREEFYNADVRRHLSDSGIPVESSKGEWGRGQHEMNIRYADVLDMADRHTVMKQAMKEIADQKGISVTFMAKPDMTEAGSSCHVHVSLWQGEEACFPGDSDLGPAHGSDTFRWFLGGLMAHLPDVMVFFAPTINSYKRYQGGSWAPTRIAWSHDNRTAGYASSATARACALNAASQVPTATRIWRTPVCSPPVSTESTTGSRHHRRSRVMSIRLMICRGCRATSATPPNCSRRATSSSKRSGRTSRSTTATSSEWNNRRTTTP